MITDRDDALWDAAEQWWEDEVEKRVRFYETAGLVVMLQQHHTDRVREMERAAIVADIAKRNLEKATELVQRARELVPMAQALMAEERASWE